MSLENEQQLTKRDSFRYKPELLVVNQATLGPNQSERSKFFSTNQNQAYSPCDPIDVTMPIYGHGNSRDPMGNRTRAHRV